MPERFDANIRTLPLFAKLPQQYLDWARDAMQVMRVEAGETVFEQGEPTRGLYLFISGSAVLIRTLGDGRRQTLGQIGANQYLNEAALFRKGEETATLKATETSTVLFVSRERLRRVVSHHPEMKAYIPIPVEAVRASQKERVFRGQRESEDVLLDTRRHPWVVVRKGWLPGLLGVGLLVIAALMPVVALSLACAGLAVVLPGALAIYYYLEWRNDHIIITTERLVRIEQTLHTFETHISEIPLSSIQQVNADIVTSDPFSRLFNYGTVDVRTAGDAGNMKLTLLPQPERVQEIIFENRNTLQQQQERRHRNTIRAEVDRVLFGEEGAAGEGGSQRPQDDDEAPARRSPWAQRFTDAAGNTVYRKHISFWARQIAVPTIFLFAAIVFFFYVSLSGLGALGLLIDVLLVTIAVLWFWWADWDWRNDLYMLGDEMIQIIHKRPLFLQNEDDQILLDRVDNVQSNKSGLLPSLLNYGTVTISLVGGDTGDAKVLRGIPDPTGVQAEVTRRQSRARSKQAEAEERRRREEIAEYLSVYHETVQAQGGTPAAGSPQVPPGPQGPHRMPQGPPQQPPPPIQQDARPDDLDPSISPLLRRANRGGERPPNIPRRRPSDEG